ncbi:MAG: hypothetical protein KAH01_06295 [Caldisericia bacterium]|nr:hypothetical protein [Caldisericia bacterium]
MKKILLAIKFTTVFLIFLLFACPMFSYSDSRRMITFADQQWVVFDSFWKQVNPGTNYFSSDEKSVFVDNDGKLHIIARYDTNLGSWVCAQITSLENAKFGTHTFIIENNLEKLDQNLVLGMFLYKYDPDNSTKRAEIDIEFSKWGFPKETENGDVVDIENNSWYVLWPQWVEEEYPEPQKTNGFMLEMEDYEYSLHQIQWEDYYLSFRSYIYNPILRRVEDLLNQYPYYHAEYMQKKFTDPDIFIPSESDKMKLIINLWLINGEIEPYNTDNKEIEIVLQYSYREPGR